MHSVRIVLLISNLTPIFNVLCKQAVIWAIIISMRISFVLFNIIRVEVVKNELWFQELPFRRTNSPQEG